MIKLNLADCIGKKYGRLTIIELAPKRLNNKTRFLVKCDCGNIKSVLHAGLLRGGTTSCGCLNKEWPWRLKAKHGMDGTPIYRRWTAIKRRCYSPKHPHYKDYGGRGIIMCDEWKEFLPFYNWAMANGYKRELQIDRIDNNGNYSPENCRFVSISVNALNRRNNICVNINGEKIAVGNFLKANNIRNNTFYARLRKGWPIEKAMTEPVKSRI